MLTQNKKFRADEKDKLISFQTVKTNYGFASDDADDIQRLQDADAQDTKDIGVILPADLPSIAMLMYVSPEEGESESSTVAQVVAAPPGVSRITLSLRKNKKYWIFVLGKGFVDGFISTTNRLIPFGEANNKRQVFAFDTSTTDDVEPDVVISDPVNEQTWYNYDGYYAGPLVWDAPPGSELAPGGGDYTYLIYYRDVLTDMLTIWDDNGVDFNSTSVSSISWDEMLRVFGAYVETGLYMTDLENEHRAWFEIEAFDQLRAFMDNNINEIHVDNRLHVNLDSHIQAVAMGRQESSFFHNWTTTSDHLWHKQVGDSVRNTGLQKKWPALFETGMEIYNQMVGQTELRDADIGATNTSEEPQPQALRSYVLTEAGRSREALQEMNIVWNPPVPREGNSGIDALQTSVYPIAQDARESILPYIQSEIERVDDLIRALGDRVFADATILPEIAVDYDLKGEELGTLWKFVVDNAFVPAPAGLTYYIEVTTRYVNTDDSTSVESVQTPFEMFGVLNEKTPSAVPIYEVELQEAPLGGAGDFFHYDVNPSVARFYDTHISKGTRIAFYAYTAEMLGTIPVWRFFRYSETNSIINEYLSTNPNYRPATSPGDTNYRRDGETPAFWVYPLSFDTATLPDKPEPGQEGQESIGFKLAHEATLQNIRYLRGLLTTVEDDLWTQVSISNTALYNAIKVMTDTVGQAGNRNNSLTNFAASWVNPQDIEVVYTDNPRLKNWKAIPTSIIDSHENVKSIDVSFLTEPGTYTFLVRPIKTRIAVVETPYDSVISTKDLNDYESKNYFYGWNIEFFQPADNGQRIGEQRLVVSSKFAVDDHQLMVSPTISGKINFDKDVVAYIWDNTFLPLLIEVDVVEHDALTLSYALYSKKELNTETGVLTIWDYLGNVFKRMAVGKRALEPEDRTIVEFREPLE